MKTKYLLHIVCGIGPICVLGIIVPLLSEFLEYHERTRIIAAVGVFAIIAVTMLLIIDSIFLLILKKNYNVISLAWTSFAIAAFCLLDFAFVRNLTDIEYVWNYTDLSTPLIFKIVGIWAGEEGSILTWFAINSIIITLFRMKVPNRVDDKVFRRSVGLSLGINLIFSLILIFYSPFEIEIPIIFSEGLGITQILQSPYLIIHPFFIFLAYAIFLIPFSVGIFSWRSPDAGIQGTFQKRYHEFMLKLGWLVLTLGIAIGVFWARMTPSWGNRYWGWDPVETVSLIPWLLSTSYFHSRLFRQKKPQLVKANVILIFLTILFASILTRAGGVSSLHSFVGSVVLTYLVFGIGVISILLLGFSLFILINEVIDNYKSLISLFDTLTQIFLIFLAFLCTFGLTMPSIIAVLSVFVKMDLIYLDYVFFSIGGLVCAVGLAISFTFCSLLRKYSAGKIGLWIITGLIVGFAISLTIYLVSGSWINPIIGIYGGSVVACVVELVRNSHLSKGIGNFFKLNGKVLIHIGITLILTGSPAPQLLQDILYISGFGIILGGIIPLIMMAFVNPQRVEKSGDPVVHSQQ